jgi:hypothetical protein
MVKIKQSQFPTTFLRYAQRPLWHVFRPFIASNLKVAFGSI